MRYRLTCKEKNIEIANQVKIADSFFSRLIGLMFKESMVGYDALLIKSCNSIHTCFMKFPIDVIFLNSKNQIVKIIRNIRPWRVTSLYFKANQVLELPGNTLSDKLEEGDNLEVVCIS